MSCITTVFYDVIFPLVVVNTFEFPSLKDASYQVWMNEEQLSELIPLTFALCQICLMFGQWLKRGSLFMSHDCIFIARLILQFPILFYFSVFVISS